MNSRRCEGVHGPCVADSGVMEEPCRTTYHTPDCGHSDCAEYPDLKDACFASRDINVTAWLCRDCAAEYHSNWDEMWAAYHADRF